MRTSAIKTELSSSRRLAQIQTEHRIINKAGSWPPGIIVSIIIFSLSNVPLLHLLLSIQLPPERGISDESDRGRETKAIAVCTRALSHLSVQLHCLSTSFFLLPSPSASSFSFSLSLVRAALRRIHTRSKQDEDRGSVDARYRGFSASFLLRTSFSIALSRSDFTTLKG